MSRLLLLCYLAVSSTAGVHAFPSSTQNNDHLDGSSMTANAAEADMQIMAYCHQQNVESSQYSVSSCKIFCAAMASVISTEFLFVVPTSLINQEIAFTVTPLEAYELGIEPHPPKQLLESI